MLFKILKRTMAPIVSLFIFMLGNGLFNTLVSIRLHMDGHSTLLIGFMTACFYFGLVVAAFRIESVIVRVGHIRAFSAFSALLTIVILLQGLYVSTVFWLVLRLIAGFATAGLFVVIESWLLSLGTLKTRGQILALYMIALYAGQALGQFLINMGSPKTLFLFVLTAMLTSLAIIPLSMTKAVMPSLESPSALGFKKLYVKSASGMMGCLVSGLCLGPLYGLLPVFVSVKTQSNAQIATYMAALILGGMVLQYPVGRISDFVERRTVLVTIIITASALAALTVFSFKWHAVSLLSIFLFGGMIFTVYPVSISHACDNLDHEDIVSGTQALLLFYSIGATIGPLLAPVPMRMFGANGLFLYFIGVMGLGLVFILWRRVSTEPSEQEESFVALPQTTTVTAELDPRGD